MAMAAAPAAKIARAAEVVAPVVKAAEEAAPAYQRLVNPAGFYSRAHEAAMTELPDQPRTWQEMHSLLSKAPRVQKEELFWSGINPETFAPNEKVSREQIAEMIEKNFPQVSPVVKGRNPEKAAELSPEYLAHEETFIDNYKDDYAQDHFNKPYEDLSESEKSELDIILRDNARGMLEVEDELNPADAQVFQGLPMHEQYTVPGGKNYNERILTHANDENASGLTPKEEDEYTYLQEEIDPEDWTEAHQNRLNELTQRILNKPTQYFQTPFRHESHLGDIDNPILHTRNSEREIPGRGKVWHQEEVQSDWAQQGREKGFQQPKLNPAEKKELDELLGRIGPESSPEDKARYRELSDRDVAAATNSGIPQAPHVRDTEHWLDLAAKDTLKNAIEGGHDHIFITGGQEQAKRWGNELRKAVDNVSWDSPENNIDAVAQLAQRDHEKIARERFKKSFDVLDDDQQYEVGMAALGQAQEAIGPDAKVVYAQPTGSRDQHHFIVKPVTDARGKIRHEVIDSSIPSAKGETLSAVLGNDLAKRIMAEDSGEQAMKGYRMGSEGYSQTYERKYPSSFKKLLKSLDPEAKIEAGPLEGEISATAANGIFQSEQGNYLHILENELQQELAQSEHGLSFDQLLAQDSEAAYRLAMRARAEAEEAFEANKNKKIKAPPVHGTWIEITPKMRAEYNRLKQKHGAVFPAYKQGGTVDANKNTRYNGAYRRLLDKALHISRKPTG
jgi:hypothetical protein